MKISKVLCLLSVLGLAAVANAQAPVYVTNQAGSFVDISTTGGIAIPGVGDDTLHNFVSTVGNPYFPAGNIRVSNNGVCISGSTAAAVSFSNATIPAAGYPVGNTGPYAASIMPHWDDLYPQNPATTIYYKDDSVNGVLTIMWKDENQCCSATLGNGITFEVMVFTSGPFIFQCMYSDTTFTLANAANNGAGATIGYAGGTSGNANALYSFNLANAVTAPATLTFMLPGAPPPAQYQVNQAGATFTLDGVNGGPYAVTTKSTTADNCTTFGSTTAAFSATGNTGNPWDLAIGTVPAVPASGPGFVLNAGPQIVNINFADPYLAFLNGFPGSLSTPFPGPFSLAYAPGGPTFAVAQMLCIDGAQIDGVSLSQANQYSCAYVPAGANPAPPVGDDVTVVCTFQGLFGGCSSAAFTFFGTSYTQFSVCTNGRVMPGNNTSTAYAPLQIPGEPTIGAWTDLNTGTAGNITFSSPSAGVARVDFNGVGFYSGVVGMNGVTMGIEMDTNTGNVQLDNLLLSPHNGTSGLSIDEFFGIAKGVGGTDPGPAGPFDPLQGAFAGPGLPTDNVYYFGARGAGATGGLVAVIFTPSTTGGSYDVQCY